MSKNSCETKKKIINAATELFCKNGYHKTTVSSICKTASVNIAAINYHFGSKDNLYLAVWDHIASAKSEAHKDVYSEMLSAEDKLRKYIEQRVANSFAKKGCLPFGRLIHWELNDPSPMYSEIEKQFLRQKRDHFFALMKEIAGNNITEDQINVCFFSMHAMLRHCCEINIAPGSKNYFSDYEITDITRLLSQVISAYVIGGLEKLSEEDR